MSVRWVIMSLFVACESGTDSVSLSDQLQGRWHVAPSAEDLHQAALLRLALQEPPPSEEALSEAGLSEADAQVVGSILALRAARPSDPQLDALRARLAGIHDATLEVTAQELRFSLGEQTSVRTYQLVEEDPPRVQLRVLHPSGEEEVDQFIFRSPNEVEMLEPGGTSTLLRREGEGS